MADVKKMNFGKYDSTTNPLLHGEYEHYLFDNCDFTNADLSEIFFSNCLFSGCNLSLVKIVKTTLRDVSFHNCKMLGLRFDNCSQFGFTIKIDNCILNHSSFYQTKLKQTLFRNTSFVEADFTQCDLSGAIFDNCDLSGATFDNANIEKADFRTAYNYSIDPERNKIKKARFSSSALSGLLDKYDLDID